jgi:hypothetical protein
MPRRAHSEQAGRRLKLFAGAVRMRKTPLHSMTGEIKLTALYEPRNNYV